MKKKKRCLKFFCLFSLLLYAVFPSVISAQEIVHWKLTKIYWQENAQNKFIRIRQAQADSRGGFVELEHHSWEPGCREAPRRATYQWRFDRDITYISGRNNELAFVSYPSADADKGKGCFNYKLFWIPGHCNDFAWTKCFNDKGACRYVIFENPIPRVEIYFANKSGEGQFIVSISAGGVSGGWRKEAVYKFERVQGRPPEDKKTFCDRYAKTAVDQNQINVKRSCGYTGIRWQSNYNNHLGWCMNTDMNVALGESRIRDEELRKCSQGKRVLGGIDLNRHCRELFGGKASVQLVQNNVNGWRCVSGFDFRSISVQDACRRQYNNSGVIARYRNANDANSWECILGNRVLGGVNLNRHCQEVFSGTASVRLIENNVNGWRCVVGQQHSINMQDACRRQYGNTAAMAQYRNANDANSWECIAP